MPKVYEPDGLFRIVRIKKPFFKCGAKLWFTQNMEGKYELHVGIFDKEEFTLRVWDSRQIHPRIKFVFTGKVYRHTRNSCLDEREQKRVVRIPFLVKSN